MNILHVNNQASVAYLISRAQRDLGHRSDLLAVPNPKQRAPDIPAKDVKDVFLNLMRLTPGYDIIHVHGGIGISGLGLMQYRALGKRFFAHYHGSELRKGIQTSFHRLAERIFISTPDLKRYQGHVGDRELIYIPNPVFIDGVVPVDWEAKARDLEKGAPLIIAHLPSIRKVKGTSNVVRGVKKAVTNGADITLDIIENVPIDEAMKRLEKAHICIDWMSPDYDIHGVVSLEAMIRGIPVVCNIDRSLYPDDIPIIASRPDELADVLKGIYDSRSDLRSRGEASRAYTLKRHHPSKVAGMIERYL